MKKAVNDNPGLLIAMPLGLSIGNLILKLLIGDYYFLMLFIITVFTLRLAFNTSLGRIFLATALWIFWVLLFPHLFIYILYERWA